MAEKLRSDAPGVPRLPSKFHDDRVYPHFYAANSGLLEINSEIVPAYLGYRWHDEQGHRCTQIIEEMSFEKAQELARRLNPSLESLRAHAQALEAREALCANELSYERDRNHFSSLRRCERELEKAEARADAAEQAVKDLIARVIEKCDFPVHGDETPLNAINAVGAVKSGCHQQREKRKQAEAERDTLKSEVLRCQEAVHQASHDEALLVGAAEQARVEAEQALKVAQHERTVANEALKAVQGELTESERLLHELMDRWRNPEYWHRAGSLQDSIDCADELAALPIFRPASDAQEGT